MQVSLGCCGCAWKAAASQERRDIIILTAGAYKPLSALIVLAKSHRESLHNLFNKQQQKHKIEGEALSAEIYYSVAIISVIRGLPPPTHKPQRRGARIQKRARVYVYKSRGINDPISRSNSRRCTADPRRELFTRAATAFAFCGVYILGELYLCVGWNSDEMSSWNNRLH